LRGGCREMAAIKREEQLKMSHPSLSFYIKKDG